MKYQSTITTFLLLFVLLAFLGAALLSVWSLWSFKETSQAQYQDTLQNLEITQEINEFEQEITENHLMVAESLRHAAAGELSYGEMYRIHSQSVDRLHQLQERSQKLLNRPEIKEIEAIDTEIMAHDFQEYMSFMIMTTDIVSIAPQEADEHMMAAQDHFLDYVHELQAANHYLTSHAAEESIAHGQALQSTFYQVLTFTILGLLLITFLAIAFGRYLAQRIQFLSGTLMKLSRQWNEPPPVLPAVEKMQQKGLQELRQLASSVLAFRRNIEDRIQAEKELTRYQNHLEDLVAERTRSLQETQAKLVVYKHIFDSVVDGVITIDEQGIIQSFNPAASNIFGWEPSSVIGEKVNILMPEPYYSEHGQYIRNYLHGRKAGVLDQQLELPGKRADGTTFPMEMSVTEVWIDQHRRFVGLMRDISSRKEAEEELRKAKEQAEAATRAKSEFVANMSHEIRTPMNGVIGMTDLLLDTELTQEQKRYARTIRSSGESLLTVINDILDFSKIEAGKMDLEIQDFDLAPLLDDCLAIMEHQAREKGLNLSCSTDAEVPNKLRGDPVRLRQILLNLTSNGIKFTHSGEVSLRVSLHQEGENRVCLLFSVRDTGVGIPQDKLDLLFDKFSQVDSSAQRSAGGTGLGLTISKHLAEMMGGEIGVQSQQDQGSVFWFTAWFEKQPEQSGQAQDREAQLEKSAPALSGRILVAEDNQVNQKVARSILEKLGLNVQVVNNGQEVLNAMETASYDLILMDVQMPEMDGLEATRRIRVAEREDEKARERLRDGETEGSESLDSRIPIIAMTAGAMQQDRDRCLEAGMDDYISKPVNREEMARVLHKWLPESSAREAEGHDPSDASKASSSSSRGFDYQELWGRVGEDQELAQEIMSLFLDSIPKNLHELKSALKQGDLSQASKQAHAIKGSSSNTGCPDVAELARKMEYAGKEGAKEDMENLLPDLESEIQLCSNQIRRVLGRE